ncbi:MAG: inositol monophosphatase family protein [Paracoccus sp. (in: a-proteobacteria)]|nr:inositol monophosphatase family protein [Paracoccus sp. (in: a-proteobacteria)]
MPDAGIAERLALAETIARDAGALAMRHFNARGDLAIGTKANAQDVFSAADRDVETLIRDAVSARFPGDGFLGEEFGLSTGTSGFTWVVDPIDGTSPFIFGLRDWCVSIAILQDMVTGAGVIFVPTGDEMFTCRQGGGAFLNGRRLSLDAQRTLGDGLTGFGANFRVPRASILRFLDELLDFGGMFIRNGSGAKMLAEVAAGRLVAYYEPHMNSWDCLAGLLLVREAGGVTGPLPDGDLLETGGPVIAAAPGAGDDLQAMVARSLAATG